MFSFAILSAQIEENEVFAKLDHPTASFRIIFTACVISAIGMAVAALSSLPWISENQYCRSIRR
jgi:hypothetical protein